MNMHYKFKRASGMLLHRDFATDLSDKYLLLWKVKTDGFYYSLSFGFRCKRASLQPWPHTQILYQRHYPLPTFV
jgi:hypothetical protein